MPDGIDVPDLEIIGRAKARYSPRTLTDALSRLREACAEAVKSSSFLATTGRTFTVPRHIDGAQFAQVVRKDAQERGEDVRRIGLRAE